MSGELYISQNWAWSAATKSLGLLLLVASFMFLSTSARAEEPSANVDDTVATVDDTATDTTVTVDDTAATVDDTATDTTVTVDDTVDDTTATVDDTIDDTTATVDDTIDDTAGDATDTVDETTATVDDIIDDTTDTIDDTIDDTIVPRDELVSIADAITSQVKQPIEDEQTSDSALTGHHADGDITRSLIDIVVSTSEPFNETSLTAMWTNLRSAAISLGSVGGPGADIGLVAVLIQLPPVVADLTRRLRLAASQGPIAAHALTIDIPG